MRIFVKSQLGMQFTYPELLWALFLLLIPVFIHLFQLRRFKKTPFTNVKVLQRIQSESRRSSTLKKWLLLFSRLALLTFLVLAFAKPFVASKSALKNKEMVIYLDDSFSMQAKEDNIPLLEKAKQELIRSIPFDEDFTLFTNEKTFRKGTIQDIQNELLALPYSQRQLQWDEIVLKAGTLFGLDGAVEKNLICISDFQQRITPEKKDSSNTIRNHLVKLAPDNTANISIDSVFIKDMGSGNIDLMVLLSGNGSVESAPVSLFNEDKLIAKTSVVFQSNGRAEVSFTVPEKEPIKGKIEITDSGLGYDNLFYFNLDQKERIKVMSIGSTDVRYLQKIFVDEEFEFSSHSLTELNYGTLGNQNLIILHELEGIPNSLSTALRSFVENGGNLTIIPSVKIDMDSYNSLLANLMGTTLLQNINNESHITDIAFGHSLFKNVFDKNVVNFQYPKVSQYYRVRTSIPTILSYQDKNPFLIGGEGTYLFTASLQNENSNFKNSSLIVPVFYNMGANSLKQAQLYQTIGSGTKVDIPVQLEKDHILKVSKEGLEFIPEQQLLSNKVSLSFDKNEIADGSYEVKDNGKPLKNISFNYPREESDLVYSDMEAFDYTGEQHSISSLFRDMQKENSIAELWKWFVILALLFLMVEILIQKYF